jgi:molybdate transport system substrate-binding protein
MRNLRLGLAFLAFSISALASAPPAADLHVFAAASLTDALTEITGQWTKSSGVLVVNNFGASSTLARQIQEGAPADLFFSADAPQMDGLESKGLIAQGTRRTLLSNTLVFVVENDSKIVIRSPEDLAGEAVHKIATGDPDAVPVGVYARTYLQKLDLWEKVSSKIVRTENVRGALAAVESGNVEVGIVYKTDALISRRVRIAFEVDAKDGPEISYPAAVVAHSESPEAARRLLGYLQGPEAQTIFRRYGFLPVH